MQTAYIIHGTADEDEYLSADFPSPSNAHWLPWLQQKFLRHGVVCQCLEMPTPHRPEYQAWAKVWGMAQLNPSSTVVAHSAGCGFILKWLGLNPQVRLGKVVLVAPWLDLDRREADFLAFKLTPALRDQMTECHVLYSEDEDVAGVKQATETIMATFPQATLHRFSTYGHFVVGDMGGITFPELWEIAK